MLAGKGSAGVALQMNLRIHCMQATNQTSEGIHCGFENQRRHHQKSRTGVSVARQKGLGFSKKRSAGVALEVNLRECVTCTPPPSSNNSAHFSFESQREHHQKSKTGVSVPPPPPPHTHTKRTWVLQKLEEKSEHENDENYKNLKNEKDQIMKITQKGLMSFKKL